MYIHKYVCVKTEILNDIHQNDVNTCYLWMVGFEVI